jgi:hypothetical protein
MVESVTPASGPQVREGVGDADEPLVGPDVEQAASESAHVTTAIANPYDFTGEWCAIYANKETAGTRLVVNVILGPCYLTGTQYYYFEALKQAVN